MGVPVCLAA